MTVSLTFFKPPLPEAKGFEDTSLLAWVSSSLFESSKLKAQALSNEESLACEIRARSTSEL